MPTPMAVGQRPLCSRSIADISGSNPADVMVVCLLCLLCVVQVAAFATSWTLIQKSRTGCVCLIVCDVGT